MSDVEDGFVSRAALELLRGGVSKKAKKRRTGEADPAAEDEHDAENSETMAELRALGIDLDSTPSLGKRKRRDEIDASGLDGALHEISLKVPGSGAPAPWVESLAVTTASPIVLDNTHDDLVREKVFVSAALEAINMGMARLDALKIPYRRPRDYYAEMVKSDGHMRKIKERLLDDKKKIDEQEERRKIRDAKKYGKQVQLAKEQSRVKEKKDNIEAVKTWRKQKKNLDDEGLADKQLESMLSKQGKDDSSAGRKPNASGDKQHDQGKGKQRSQSADGKKLTRKERMRQSKDSKWGFGGRKRGLKTNSRESLDNDSDRRGRFDKNHNKSSFPGKQRTGMGNKKGNVTKKRPGKNRRNASHH